MAHPGVRHPATPTAPVESPRAESPAATPVPARPAPEPPTAELGPEEVEPLGAVSAPEASAPPAAPPAHGVRRALVAEDSIAARIFLVRLLEEQGFEVHAVASAAELRGALAGGPWTLVCADGELPDAHGAEFMAELARDASRAGSPLVALVRDAADETAAREAGVTATLRKPFGRQALEQMLERVSDAGHAGRNTGTAGSDPNPREWGAR
jgi:CheY-like chemotaxis protein